MKPSSVKKLLISIAILAVLASAPFTAEAQRRRAVERPSGDITLTGIVTDSSTGEPVVSAIVAAQGRSTLTDTEGRYALDELLPGTWPVTVDRWGYQGTTREIEITGNSTADFVLELLPFIVLTRTDGTTTRYIVEGSKYGYVIPFTGSVASPTLKVCTGDPNEPIELEASDIRTVMGPSTRIDTSCCSKSKGEQITIETTEGETFDAVILDSCPPNDIYFIGRSLDKQDFVFSRLSLTESIEYPE